jgi:hypothetical protein
MSKENGLNFITDLTNREYNDKIKLLMFYCNILLEKNCHSNSYRCMYAYKCLKLAKQTLKDEFEWSILPIDIDNFQFQDIGIIDQVKDSKVSKSNKLSKTDVKNHINTSLGLNIKTKTNAAIK